jgi:hypothetical protein
MRGGLGEVRMFDYGAAIVSLKHSACDGMLERMEKNVNSTVFLLLCNQTDQIAVRLIFFLIETNYFRNVSSSGLCLLWKFYSGRFWEKFWRENYFSFHFTFSWSWRTIHTHASAAASELSTRRSEALFARSALRITSLWCIKTRTFLDAVCGEFARATAATRDQMWMCLHQQRLPSFYILSFLISSALESSRKLFAFLVVVAAAWTAAMFYVYMLYIWAINDDDDDHGIGFPNLFLLPSMYFKFAFGLKAKWKHNKTIY